MKQRIGSALAVAALVVAVVFISGLPAVTPAVACDPDVEQC